MKKMTKELLTTKLNDATVITGYVYTFTGLEKQSDKISVHCPKHNYTQQQSREYTTQARLIACCNKFAPMITTDFESIISKFKDKEKIKIIGEFSGYDTSVNVVCHEHGERTIKLTSLMAKKTEFACNKCSHKKYNRNFAFNKEKWIENSKIIHGDVYDYSKLEDSGLHRTIICKKHGEFFQNIHNHVYLKNGCPKCVVTPNVSQAEHELCDFFNSLGFVQGVDYTRNDRSVLNKRELDFYFNKLKIGIEYNGDYWHSEGRKENDYHQEKKINGINCGINIIMIYEYQYKTKKDIILNRLKSILGKDNCFYAKKTEIKEVSYKESSEFLNKYHIQGTTVSSIRYGLYINQELISLMCFGKSRFTTHEFELLRYVSNNTVVGGASRLFKHFVKIHSPKNVLSYADFDWSVGNMYEKIGFTKIGMTTPSYVWVKGIDVISRYQCQIPNEDIIMKEKGYLKLYKCGSLKYEWCSQ